MGDWAPLLVSNNQALFGNSPLRIPQPCHLSAERLEVGALLGCTLVQLAPDRSHIGRQMLRRLRC
jgi:hypothetical protein